jgi:putative ABC transport system permease protein
MIKNYIKTAWRNLTRNKVYSFINITGLTMGLTACLIVATVVLNDLSYDRQWSKSKQVFRTVSITNNNLDKGERFARAFSGLGPALKKDFPEVQDYCRMDINDLMIRFDSSSSGIKLNLLASEPSVWNFLDFKILEGNPKQLIKGYPNLVISEKTRDTYYKGVNPIGKVVTRISSSSEAKEYVISGVIKEIPSNTHLSADGLLVRELRPMDDELFKEEYGSFMSTYLLLQPGINIGSFTDKINSWYKNYVTSKKPQYSFRFQNIEDVHLYSDFSKSEGSGSIQTVYIFSGVAILLLFIACINFINLTTARVLKRVKETGIRKVLGAEKKQLIGQFMFESLLFFLISFVFSVILYNLFISSTETFIGHPLALNFTGNLGLFAAASSIILLVSLFTGFYPAWILSQPKPVNILSGKLGNYMAAAFLRKGLVTVQFIFSIAIIIAAIVVQTQVNYIDKKDLGFEKDNLFKTDFSYWDKKGDFFKQQVSKIPGVESVSFTGWAPSLGGGSMSTQVSDPTDEKNKITAWYIQGDINLASTLKLELLKGRWLNPALSTDALNADSLMEKDFVAFEQLQKTQPVLISAYTARLLNIKELNQPHKSIIGIPVGIVKDFNNESLHNTLKPCAIRANSGNEYGYMLVKVKPGTGQHFTKQFEKIWNEIYPQKALSYNWISDAIDAQYREEKTLQQLFLFFGGLTVFLACLGLFGLATFTAEQRIKEIGIRKVIGASVAGITFMLSKDFIRLILLAIVIAAPVTIWLMNKWLQDYAYRITITWWMIAFAGLFAITIAVITVGYKSIKAAMANPVKSLRTE